MKAKIAFLPQFSKGLLTEMLNDCPDLGLSLGLVNLRLVNGTSILVVTLWCKKLLFLLAQHSPPLGTVS